MNDGFDGYLSAWQWRAVLPGSAQNILKLSSK